jgi:hypothetical protein
MSIYMDSKLFLISIAELVVTTLLVGGWLFILLHAVKTIVDPDSRCRWVLAILVLPYIAIPVYLLKQFKTKKEMSDSIGDERN